MPAKRFAQLARQLSSHSIEGQHLTERFLSHITNAGHDVLQQSYISTALDFGLFNEAQLLRALLASSTGSDKDATNTKRSSSTFKTRDQLTVIRIVSVSCNSRARPRSQPLATNILNAVSRWMVRISPALEQPNGISKDHLNEHDDLISLRKAVAGLFCELVNSNNYVRSALEPDPVPGKDEILRRPVRPLT